MQSRDIINELARGRVVETMAANIAHRDLDDNLQDLCQIIYMSLLDKPPERIEELHHRNELNYYISQMIKNQYFTKNSPWHNTFRKHQRMGEQIDGLIEYAEQ